MTPPVTLVERLAALPKLKDIPRSELEWLAAHGEFETHAAGEVVAPRGVPVHHMWIMISGQVTHQTDRGTGPRRVVDWGPGDVTGMLPYSRMKGPPGDSYVNEDAEVLRVHEGLFNELAYRCPEFTAYTVHHMLDRARTFKVSYLQDEKMLSLGKLAAGLAHEINNPASAAMRSAKHLRTLLADLADASRHLGAAGLSDEALAAIEQTRRVCMAHPDDAIRSPLEQADREDEIAEWLDRHGADGAHAEALAETSVTLEGLDSLAAAVPGSALDPSLHWIATGCTTQSLARDIEDAATRIHELVSAVKRFTYMDALAGAEPVDVVAGLRDTIRVLAAKAKERQASVSLDASPDLPRAHAIGNELNQVWLNLVDNALDAVEPSGQVTIAVRPEKDRLVVRVTDDGHGIPPDILPRIFDPFFTTKPQGEGTGLGLEITQQLVRQSNGDITVRSRPGHTEFLVSLPQEEPSR